MKNQLTIAQKATIEQIRADSQTFPRIHTYSLEESIQRMTQIILMAHQFRGQQTDADSIIQMAATLIDLLLEDEYGIGTQYLSFEEIRRVVRRAVLGQGKEIFGITVSSIYQALADYCREEGRKAQDKARKKTIDDNPMVDILVRKYAQLMNEKTKVTK